MSQVVIAEQSLSARVKVGDAQGHLHILPDGYRLNATVKKLADYSENWIFPAAVLDYHLPQKINLAKDVNRVSLSFLNPEKTNKDYQSMLRVLIEDQRGHVFAVGTRLGAKQSELPVTDHLRTLQSFDWNINEMGRIDPWVMMRVTPASPDYYDAPQQPLRLVGFRMVLRGIQKKSVCQVTIKNIQPLTADEKASPYWQIDPDQQWINHVRKPHDKSGRYGWGPAEPGPYLKASDMHLHSGKTLVSWEILETNDWQVIASDHQIIPLVADSIIQLPLLEAGTYRIKLHAIQDNAQVQSRYMQYVVLRNSRGSQEHLPHRKPLAVESSNHSNVFDDASKAFLAITSTQAGQVQWSLVTSDGKPVAHGKSTHIALGEYFKQHRVLWLKAELRQEGEIVDQLERVLGLRSAAPILPNGNEVVIPKVHQFAGKLRRVKGDWNEGATPIASDAQNVLENFRGWLDDAVETGYNIVELSAPWYDLNPLPGVYQFEYLDQLIALAQQRNLMVTLRIHPMIRQVPGYVPRQLMQDQAGFAHGLWSGSDNQLFSPAAEPYRKASTDYITALAARYRKHTAVLGYTIESLFFDHDMIDMPWLGQLVDYSQTMRRGFVDWLKEKYASINKLNKIYQTQYVHWEQIELPHVRVKFDDDGRPMPQQSPVIRDWLNYKVYAITRLRTGWLEAARKADPGAFLGIYNTGSTEFYLDTIKQLEGVITYGSMEAQYPRKTRPNMAGRFEPHAKIARTAMLVDVGLSNLLMIDQPGMHGLFNYWKPQWKVKDQPAVVVEAEERLKTWFGLIDQITHALPVEEIAQKQGAFLVCDETLLYEHGHLFYDRIHDYLKPFEHHVAASDMHVDALHTKDVDGALLENRPWVYVPYASDILSEQVVNALKKYVMQGGTLIMEAGSGKWALLNSKSDVLSQALGMGTWQSIHTSENKVTGHWQGCVVNLRTKPWNPPINHQPTPWIHNIAGGYLQLGRWSGLNPKSDAVITAHPLGDGQVLAIGGVVDWLSSPGLLRAIEISVTKQSASQTSTEHVQILKRQFQNQNTNFLVGRRFISQNEIDLIKKGHPDQVNQESVTCKMKLVGLESTAKYRVVDLLDGLTYTAQTGELLMREGLRMSLKPGQAFVLKFEQE